MAELPSQPLQGLIDGMAVLQALSSAHGEMAGLQISKELGIEKTKVNRILKSLAYLGFVYPTSNRKYTLGPAIHVLSAQTMYGSGLIQHSLASLMELTALNVIVAMGVLWRDKVAYLYHWKPGISSAKGLGRVDLFPATQSSIGLMLLSEKNDEEIQQVYYNKDIPGFKGIDELLSGIKTIRKRGYAEALYEGRKSASVKIGTPAYAALAIADETLDVTGKNSIALLMEKATQIEEYQTLNNSKP